MHTIKTSALADFIRHVVLDMNEPAMVWGPPGCGKSAVMAQVAEDISGVLCDNRLAQYDSVDLRGYPGSEAGHYVEGGAMVWSPPVTFPFVGNKAFPADRPIILFLDELNSAKPDVLAVAYQLINDRRVGEHVLMENVRIVAAGNREGDRGVTNKMPLPLANRMTHVEVAMDHESWINHYLDTGGDPVIAAFFMFRPSLICTFDPSKQAKAFGTFRSWSKAAKYFVSDLPKAVKYAAIAGAVGDGEAAEFLGYMDIVAKMPDMDDIVARPTKAALPDGVGMMYAVSGGLSARLKMSAPEVVTAVDTYLKRLPPEFYAYAWMSAARRDDRLLTTSEGAAFAEDFQRLIG